MSKTAIPLVLAAGAAAALLLTGKKKKPIPSGGKGKTPGEVDTDFIEVTIPEELGGGIDERMVFNEECSAIINKIDLTPGGAHDTWLTNRFIALLKEVPTGAQVDMNAIAIQLLREQSQHCPWGNPESWTPLMEDLHKQLLGALTEYHAMMTSAGKL